MDKTKLHDLRYIDWRKVKGETISQEEWNKKVDMLVSNSGNEILFGQRKNTVKSAWLEKEWNYCIADNDKVSTINITHVNNRGKYNQKVDYFKYMTYKNEDKNDYIEKGAKDEDMAPGRTAMKMIEDSFKKEYDLTLRRAFGYITDKTLYDTIRHCAVAAPPLIYVVPKWFGKIYYHGYKADISSAYPDTMRGHLPDWHTVEIIPGRQEPNEEYPFVYWSDGHHAEFGVYDTREFLKNKWFLATNDKDKDKKQNFKTDGIIVSYCCKSSKYKLDSAMQELYFKKENDKENKDMWKKMLVSFVGKLFEKTDKPFYPMPHLAATCHGRQIKKMLDIAAVLEAEDNIPISFATDSIIWCGKKSKITTPSEFKILGSFVSEFEDVEFAFGGVGLYALKKDNKIGLIKHQGRSVGKFENIHSLEQFLSICKSKQQIEYIGYDKKTKKYIKKWRI